ncbi:hypothetical protein [Arthrobacter sp. StoSoilB13]|uniref:hypothetical protein n=1 Tax=Arthrobacter sp. StoSoilB13 TaxID=2830993 RepID=UPI001CC76E2B|nr:hypothetical protein [Arthrobacter sp. StoSoilB13]BCW51093.1 hypothetical protein StoSoilB13_34350 [Arthrobacter sp. StoSoilB13]
MAFPHSLVEAGFDCCEAFGEVVGEGDGAVVDVFQAAVEVHAAAAEFAEVDVVAAFVPESAAAAMAFEICVPGTAIGIVAKADWSGTPSRIDCDPVHRHNK